MNQTENEPKVEEHKDAEPMLVVTEPKVMKFSIPNKEKPKSEENLVEHALVDSYSGIEELRQSKYLSSSVGDVYKKVKEELLKGRLVAFCGSPCQIEG